MTEQPSPSSDPTNLMKTRVDLPIEPESGKARGPVSWRSLFVGLLGTTLICGGTPYNDYLLNNTPMVGNYLPLGVLLLTMILVLCVNAPLHRWAPRQALSTGELAVAIGMVLVSAWLPGNGLMRYFPSSLVGPIWAARGNTEFRSILSSLDLPSLNWLLPRSQPESILQGSEDPLVSGYIIRWTGEDAPPYLAWLLPAFSWGIFLGAFSCAVLCLIILTRRQWVENERLAFPLAQIPLALIEPPRPGRALNQLLGSRLFWLVFLGATALRGWNGLAAYWPKYFPVIPLGFDFRRLFSEPPFSYLDGGAMQCDLQLTVIGVTYFVPMSVAFSLWSMYLLMQVYRMGLGTATGDPVDPGRTDQHAGAIIGIALITLWLGRHHWKMILLQAFRGVRGSEPRGRYISYRAGAWGLALSVVIMIGWMWFAGASWITSVVTVGLLLTLMLVIARVVAETGLVYGELQLWLTKPWIDLVSGGFGKSVSTESFYLATLVNSQHYAYREPLSVYASHGLRGVDRAVHEDTDEVGGKKSGMGVRVVLAMLLAIGLGYVISFASTLHMQYTFASSLDIPGQTPQNVWGNISQPRSFIVDPVTTYDRGLKRFGHNTGLHVVAGLGITLGLAALRFRFAWWPFHPVGFLMLAPPPLHRMWPSIFIGWALKYVILRFGGSKLYVAAKPVFLGLILGETAAAGIWLLVGLLCALAGVPHLTIKLLPG